MNVLLIQDPNVNMKNYKTDDSFLGRWIANELSEEERIAFEKTTEFKQFTIINAESLLLEGPTINTEAALQKIKKQLQKKPKVINLKHYMRFAIAAIFIISLGFFASSSKTYTTTIGDTQTIILADGSVVNLNSNSSLSHKRFFWSNDKEVVLNGEAYFSIAKGDGFNVVTSKGTVTVLGTQFNIKDRNYFSLKCYEGKVKFSSHLTRDTILTKGMEIAVSEDNNLGASTFTERQPAWKKGISSFKNQPFSDVLEELSNYYTIEFDINNIDTNRLFTGSFKHNDLNLALQSTLIPMEIKYELLNDNTTIVLSK